MYLCLQYFLKKIYLYQCEAVKGEDGEDVREDESEGETRIREDESEQERKLREDEGMRVGETEGEIKTKVRWTIVREERG